MSFWETLEVRWGPILDGGGWKGIEGPWNEAERRRVLGAEGAGWEGVRFGIGDCAEEEAGEGEGDGITVVAIGGGVEGELVGQEFG